MIRRIALVLSFAFAALGQQQPQPLTESIEVQLTNLDVVVTDASGKHVPGLTIADFEIVENGRRREITNISEFRRGTTATEATQITPRRILVAVDNRTIALSARKKTVAAVRSTIDQLLSDPGDQLMIVTISGSPKPRTGWTSDRAQIARVLDEIERDAPATRIDMAEIDNMLGEMIHVATGGGAKSSVLARRRQRSSGSGGGRGQSTAPMQEDEEPFNPGVDYNLILSRTRTYAGMVAAETEQTISSLASSLTQFSTATEGKRLVVLVGGALPIFPGADVFQRLEAALREIERHDSNTGENALARSRRQNSAIMEKVSFDMSQQLDTLANYARMKGIAFYAVNPEIHDRGSKDVSSRHAAAPGQDFAAGNAAVDGFERLASATGGASHVGRNAELALTEVQNDLDSYYSIGYRSTEPLTPDTKIVVKAKNGLKTRATLTAANIAPEWRIADAVVNNHAKAPEVNDLGIFLVANPVKTEGETRQIKVNVMIPFDRLRLVRDGRDYNCSFTVFVSVGDANGGANPLRETRNLRWDEETVNKLRGKNIAYGLNLTVGPGRDRVSVGILDLGSGSTGYGRAMLAQ